MSDPANAGDECTHPSPSTVSIERAAHLIGASVGPYRLMEKIGEGGFGLVFVAEQQRPVKRKVAIKVIKPGMDTREVIARFEAERQALALMDHPHIARVFDAGTTESGHPYFVMELVRGIPITDYCDQNRLTLRERLELFVTVCQAIQHAHQKGIIHRDIKPSNVLVTLHDGRPVVKVIDFGVAKALHQQLTDKTIYTRFAQVIGTPVYMSPEQAEMSGLDIDTRSDVYSLGVLLYELLTGTTPFDRKRLAKVALDEWIRIIRQEEPPKPSTRLRQSSETLPSIAAQRRIEPAKLSKIFRGDLDWITMKALEKDRTRRYETASALAADVLHYLRDEPVSASPPSTIYLLKKFARRYRAILITGAAFVVLLLTGVVVSTVFGMLANRARVLAEQMRQKADDEAENARQAQKTAETAHQAEAAERQKAQLALDRSENSLYLNRIALAERNWQANNSRRASEILELCPAKFRDWEWHYLNRLVHSEVMTFPGDNVAYSPDGKQLATSDPQSGDAICIRDTRTGTTLRRLEGGRPIPFIQSIVFSSDGRQLAAVCQDSAIRIWDLSDGRQTLKVPVRLSEKTMKSPFDHPVGLAFSPDGKRVALAGLPSEEPKAAISESLIVWDATTGKELLKVSETGQSLAFSPDGKHLATTRFDFVKVGQAFQGPVTEGIRILDADTGRVLTQFPPWRGEVDRSRPPFSGADEGHLTYSPDGKWLASARGNEIKVWDVAGGKEVRTFRGHEFPVTAIFFSSDNNRIVSGSCDETVRIWDRRNFQVKVYRGHAVPVTGVSVPPDGRRIASAAQDGTVRIWDATAAQGGREIPGTAGWNATIAISPDGQSVACLQRTAGAGLSPQGQFKLVLVDAATGHEIRSLRRFLPLRGTVHGNLAFSSDGRLLTSALENEVQVWDVGSGMERAKFAGVSDIARRGLAFSPDGHKLAFTARDNSVEVWGVQDHKLLSRCTAHQGPVTTISFNTRGERVASGGIDHTVNVWDAANGQVILSLNGATSGLANVVFSPDGNYLVTSCPDNAVRVWDLSKGAEFKALRGHKASIWSIAFNATGTRLVTGGADSVLRLWTWPACEEILSLPEQHLPMLAKFIAAGKKLAAASNSGLTVWDATPRSTSERVQE